MNRNAQSVGRMNTSILFRHLQRQEQYSGRRQALQEQWVARRQVPQRVRLSVRLSQEYEPQLVPLAGE